MIIDLETQKDKVNVFKARLFLSFLLTFSFSSLSLVGIVFPEESLYIFWPIIQCAGVCLPIVNFHLANLYPNIRSTLVATINGSCQAGVIQSIVMSKLFYNLQFNINQINAVYV